MIDELADMVEQVQVRKAGLFRVFILKKRYYTQKKVAIYIGTIYRETDLHPDNHI